MTSGAQGAGAVQGPAAGVPDLLRGVRTLLRGPHLPQLRGAEPGVR